MNKNKALLIIDIQNDYFKNGKFELVGAEQAGEKAGILLEEFRKNSLPVIHIQHLSTRADASFFIPDTEGAEIHHSVKPLSHEKVIIKHYPNSFRDTELLEYLRAENIQELVIAGMMTHMCVDATTRAAKDIELDCTVIGDACATRDLEIYGEKVEASEVQKAFLSALNYFYSTVTTTEKYISE